MRFFSKVHRRCKWIAVTFRHLVIAASARVACHVLLSLCSMLANRCHGTCVLRYYWSQFLAANKDAVRGRGLEIDQTSTLTAHGGDQITEALAINIVPGPGIDIVADLADAGHMPADSFDVFINQFAFHVIHDDQRALYHSIRMLKPGGTLLCNFVCTAWFPENGFPCGESRFDMCRWYTPAGVRSMLLELLPEDSFTLTVYGNRMMHIAYVLA